MGVSLTGRPPWTEILLDRDPLDRDPPGQRPPDRDPTPRGPPPDRDPLDRDPPEQRPRCGQTPVKTLPSQIPFAG